MIRKHGAFHVMRKKSSGLGTARRLLGEESETRETPRREEYKEFDDVASGGWTYYGDGRAQEEWFKENSNVDSLIRGMSSEERDAFFAWTRGNFMGGQQWRGFDNMSGYDQQYTRVYDKYFDQSRLDKGVTVVRLGSAELLGLGTHARSLDELRALEGREVIARGSMSFGAAKQGLTIGGSKNVEYKLRIPGGTTGAGMWVGDSRINGWGSDQREFVTNRDVTYKVGKTTYDSKRRVYVVELEYGRRLEHDYGRRGR